MIHTHSVPLGSGNPGDLWVKAGAAVTADDFLWTVFPDAFFSLLAVGGHGGLRTLVQCAVSQLRRVELNDVSAFAVVNRRERTTGSGRGSGMKLAWVRGCGWWIGFGECAPRVLSVHHVAY